VAGRSTLKKQLQLAARIYLSMNRRNFLSLFSAGLAGIALEQAIPLGRGWSFPKQIVLGLPPNAFLTTEWITMETLRIIQNKMELNQKFSTHWDKEVHRPFRVGQVIHLKQLAGIDVEWRLTRSDFLSPS